jgi:hypothetical protein
MGAILNDRRKPSLELRDRRIRNWDDVERFVLARLRHGWLLRILEVRVNTLRRRMWLVRNLEMDLDPR